MKLAVLTTGRQDYGVLRPVCVELARSRVWSSSLLVGGLHLGAHRETSRAAFARDGFVLGAELSETAGAGAEQASAMVGACAAALRAVGAQGLLLVGDRSETAAAALGATLERVPIVHLHGGEETEGAIDNALRHAITKLSHLHLVSHEQHARRVRQMGEQPSSVHVVGAPSLDNALRMDIPDRATLAAHLGIDLTGPIVIVTHHPATLGADAAAEVATVITALEQVDRNLTFVVTLPNNDAGTESVRSALLAFAQGPRRVAVEALGESRYFGLMRIASAMVGNSSSGLIEAPLFQLPVVNVGDRQAGRLAGQNVIHASGNEIAAALTRALTEDFANSLRGTTSPYGDGHSAPRVVAVLDAWTPPVPPRKRFYEVAA